MSHALSLKRCAKAISLVWFLSLMNWNNFSGSIAFVVQKKNIPSVVMKIFVAVYMNLRTGISGMNLEYVVIYMMSGFLFLCSRLQ